MECMIEIENLSLTMKKQVILSDINLTFEKGKIHGLIGRNGSGKTMLMKCILGSFYILLTPQIKSLPIIR